MNKKSLNDNFARYATNIIFEYKYFIFISIFLLLLTGFYGMQRLQMDSSNESFMAENDPTILKNEEFKDLFGSEEFLFILVESDDIFTYETLRLIRELTEDLEENLPFAGDITSITNLDYIEGRDDRLVIDNLIGEDIPTDQNVLNNIRNKLISNKLYLDRIISGDSKMTGIVVDFKRITDSVYASVPDNFSPLDQAKYSSDRVLMNSDLFPEGGDNHNKIEDPRKIIAPALEVILKRHRAEDTKITATGVPILDYEMDLLVMEEGAKFGLIALLASTLLMFLIFRNLKAIISTFLIVLSSLIVVFGILGWLKIKLSLLALVIPTLILVISVSYSIHVINHFLHGIEKKSRKEAIRYTFQESTWPIFVTALTTALGFFSFVFVPISPVKVVGIACAMSAFITYILVMIIVPTVFSLSRKEIKGGYNAVNMDAAAKGSDTVPTNDVISKNKLNWDRSMIKWSNVVIKYEKNIVFTSLILVIILVISTFNMQMNSDLMQMVGNEVSFVKSAEYITDRLGALYSYELLIEFPEPNMLKKSKVLVNIEGLTEEITGLNSTVNTISLNNLVKEMHLRMNEDNEDYYQIPDSDNLISQYYLLYEISGGDNLQDMVDFDYQKTHISVQINEFKTSIEQDFERINQYVKNNFPTGTKITIVGDIPIMLKTIELLTEGQILSIVIALLVITLIMIIILGSVKLGLLSMIPNVIPILVITGLMGLLQYQLDMITVLIAPMIIGIAVDDTVHYFLHFKKEYYRTGSYETANQRTFRKIGRALVSTSIILIMGFVIFSLSRMDSMVHMAVLAAGGIFSALLADMMITPAIMKFVTPLDNETKKEEGSYEY